MDCTLPYLAKVGVNHALKPLVLSLPFDVVWLSFDVFAHYSAFFCVCVCVCVCAYPHHAIANGWSLGDVGLYNGDAPIVEFVIGKWLPMRPTPTYLNGT